MSNSNKKTENRERRRGRVRAKVSGTENRPRMSVFRSNSSMYVQLIDDRLGRTLLSARLHEVKKKGGQNPMERASELGKLIALKAQEKNIKSIVFDRGGYKYHGRVKSLAEGAREGGLEF